MKYKKGQAKDLSRHDLATLPTPDHKPLLGLGFLTSTTSIWLTKTKLNKAKVM